MFPTGTAGVGLLFLRVAIAVAFLIDGTAHWTLVTSWWSCLLYVVPAVALCVGFLTPCCALFCSLIELGVLGVTWSQNAVHLTFDAVASAALATLGPGAYSLDGRIYGRRLLNLPLRDRS